MRPRPGPEQQSTFDVVTSNPYTNSMPDVLTMKNGTRVTDPSNGPRAAPIQEDFEPRLRPNSRPCAEGELGDNGHDESHQRHPHRHQNPRSRDNKGYNLTVNIQASSRFRLMQCACADHD